MALGCAHVSPAAAKARSATRSTRLRRVAAHAALPRSAAPPLRSAAELRTTLAASAAALALALLPLALSPLALAAEAPAAAAPVAALNPPELFARTCGGCHTGGGNIVELGATLRADALERNGYADAASVAKLIYAGKGKMPGYGEGCAPRGQCTFGARLSDSDIDKLAAYVLEQAAAGWPSAP